MTDDPQAEPPRKEADLARAIRARRTGARTPSVTNRQGYSRAVRTPARHQPHQGTPSRARHRALRRRRPGQGPVRAGRTSPAPSSARRFCPRTRAAASVPARPISMTSAGSTASSRPTSACRGHASAAGPTPRPTAVRSSAAREPDLVHMPGTFVIDHDQRTLREPFSVPLLSGVQYRAEDPVAVAERRRRQCFGEPFCKFWPGRAWRSMARSWVRWTASAARWTTHWSMRRSPRPCSISGRRPRWCTASSTPPRRRSGCCATCCSTSARSAACASNASRSSCRSGCAGSPPSSPGSPAPS